MFYPGSIPRALLTIVLCYLALLIITPPMLLSNQLVLPMAYYFTVSVIAGGIIQHNGFIWGLLVGAFPILYGFITLNINEPSLYINYYIPLPLLCALGTALGETLYRKVTLNKQNDFRVDLKSKHCE